MHFILSEALRHHFNGIAILPIPHGHTEPRFRWTEYIDRKPTRAEVEAWLGMDVGIGAVGGKVSGNLVALKFTAPTSYLRWANANPELAERLPTIGSDAADFVLFRTPSLVASTSLFLPGMPQRAGRIISDGGVFPLPPTRDTGGNPLKWINGIGPQVEVLTLEQAGVIAGPTLDQLPQRPRRDGPTPDVAQRLAMLHGHRQDELSDADRYSHLFKSPSEYRGLTAREEMRWVVKDLLPETYLAILAGESKSGKSCLATTLALAVAGGDPFLGMPTAKGTVLWVAYEESHEERGLVLDAFPEIPENFLTTHEKLYIDTPEGLAALRWCIRNTRARLVVLDPLYAAIRMESLSDGRSAREALSGLKELCRVEGCAALVLHHLTKNVGAGMTRERFADSNQILATASMDILMDTRVDRDGLRHIALRCRGRGAFANRSISIVSESMGDYRPSEIHDHTKRNAIVEALESAGACLSAAEIGERCGISVKTIRNMVPPLLGAGTIRVANKKGNRQFYALSHQVEDHAEPFAPEKSARAL